ncbi:hypothetical protein N7931_10955 [Catenovulum sp. 2E275]|uniref:hypothetical protein n=1 Tax=Catenovulum sp. 2E275 TaxID=2980497 RepID=UPI0021D07874|nr:hypothetical protein [Catenovulum sp. 2E275]MCU4676148.1 hypothetical protein [Catenovulum sp. 2E275]
MKKLITIAVMLVSNHLYANTNSSCVQSSSQIKAQYQITESQQNHQQSRELTLWRNGEQVAHQSDNIVELWQHLKNNQIRPIRYFTEHKRGIEYQPSEVTGKQSWSAKYQLLDKKLIDKMKLVSEQGQGCDKSQLLEFADKNIKIKVNWLPELQLAQSIQISQGQYAREIKLLSKNTDKTLINQQFKQWDLYQTTDYADVGDNENDPFLAKMINQGFIEHGATGFYNQNGEMLQGHGHHH